MKKSRDILFFFISTKFLPTVAAILPLWIIARNLGLLNTRLVLIILYMGINIPLAVWMLRSFFKEVPDSLIEASQLDGANLRQQITRVMLPIVAPGLAATALLVVIFAWNEFFLAVQLNPVDGSTIPIWVTSNVSTRGNFLAKLSAASTLATLPVVLAGNSHSLKRTRANASAIEQIRSRISNWLMIDGVSEADVREFGVHANVEGKEPMHFSPPMG